MANDVSDIRSPESTATRKGAGKSQKVEELVAELKGSSAVQRKLLDEIAVVREHMENSSGVTHDAYTTLQNTLQPLLADLASKNLVIAGLLQEIEDKNALITVLKRNVETEKGRGTIREGELTRDIGSLTEEDMRAMPVDTLVNRVIETQRAAFANYKTAEDAKNQLYDVRNEIMRIKDRMQSCDVLREGVTKQSECILHLQDEVKHHERRFEKAKEVALQQEQVIEKMEQMMKASATSTNSDAAAGSQQVISSLKLKLAAAQRREQQNTEALLNMKDRTGATESQRALVLRLQSEVDKMHVSLASSEDPTLSASLMEANPEQTDANELVKSIREIRAKWAEDRAHHEQLFDAVGALRSRLRELNETDASDSENASYDNTNTDMVEDIHTLLEQLLTRMEDERAELGAEVTAQQEKINTLRLEEVAMQREREGTADAELTDLQARCDHMQEERDDLCHCVENVVSQVLTFFGLLHSSGPSLLTEGGDSVATCKQLLDLMCHSLAACYSVTPDLATQGGDTFPAVPTVFALPHIVGRAAKAMRHVAMELPELVVTPPMATSPEGCMEAWRDGGYATWNATLCAMMAQFADFEAQLPTRLGCSEEEAQQMAARLQESETLVDKMAQQLGSGEGSEGLAAAQQENEALQMRLSIMEENGSERERKAAQEISRLKLQLSEAKAFALAAKPPSPSPSVPASTTPPAPEIPAKRKVSKTKRLDPIVPRHRFQD